MNLNTTNPQHLLYQYEQLHFEVLGGIKLDILNSMRATIKIKHFNAEQRHTLDLYNATSLQRFLKTAAEALEIGVPYLNTAVASLINELEVYRLAAIEQEKSTTIQQKNLSEEEKAEAIKSLKSNNLLQTTNELLGKSGIIGEEINRLIMYIIFTSRKLSNPLHVISLAASGTGKSYLQEKVSQVIPDEDKKEITALSPNSFYYQGQYDLKHKLILLEDLTGAESSLYPIREIQTKHYIIKEVSHKNSKGDTITITKRVEGPVCISACTTSEQVYEDNANRSFLLYLDDSEEQDNKIMEHQRKGFAGKVDKHQEQQIKNLLQNAQRMLKPITVVNPYAELLHLPKEVFKKRRTNAHMLQFIEALTFCYQYQREQKVNEETGEIYIETTPQDIQEASELIKHILIRKSDELNGATRKYLEMVKSYLKINQQATFKTKEVRNYFRLSPSSQKQYMLSLIQSGYIYKKEGDQKKGFEYSICNVEEYKALEEQVNKIMAQNQARIIQMNIPVVQKLKAVKKAI